MYIPRINWIFLIGYGTCGHWRVRGRFAASLLERWPTPPCGNCSCRRRSSSWWTVLSSTEKQAWLGGSRAGLRAERRQGQRPSCENPNGKDGVVGNQRRCAGWQPPAGPGQPGQPVADCGLAGCLHRSIRAQPGANRRMPKPAAPCCRPSWCWWPGEARRCAVGAAAGRNVMARPARCARQPQRLGCLSTSPIGGYVKFSHTDPLKSNSGFMTIPLMTYGYHGKTSGLTRR